MNDVGEYGLDELDDGFNPEDDGFGLGLEYEDHKHNTSLSKFIHDNPIPSAPTLEEILRAELDKAPVDVDYGEVNHNYTSAHIPSAPTLEQILAGEVDYIRKNPPLKRPKNRPIEIEITIEPTIHYAEEGKLSRQDLETINRNNTHKHRKNTLYINREQLLYSIRTEIGQRKIPSGEKKKLLSEWCATYGVKYKNRESLLDFKAADGKPILNRVWDRMKQISPKKKQNKKKNK